MKMLLSSIFAVFGVTVANAQDIVFLPTMPDMTNIMLSQSAQAAASNLPDEFEADSSAHQDVGDTTLLPPDALNFRPASALRRQILNEYFPTVEAKAELKAVIGGDDLIAAMDGLLPQFGLRTDNVADAMTVWAVGAYSLIHYDDRQLDKATAE
ncbi:MAG: hypothetical protein ACRBEQ_14265, partial [Hyphomonas sp.]